MRFNYNTTPKSTYKNKYRSPYNPNNFLTNGTAGNNIEKPEDGIFVQMGPIQTQETGGFWTLGAPCSIDTSLCRWEYPCYNIEIGISIPTSDFAENDGPDDFIIAPSGAPELSPYPSDAPFTDITVNTNDGAIYTNFVKNGDSEIRGTYSIKRNGNAFDIDGEYTIDGIITVNYNDGHWSAVTETHIQLPVAVSDFVINNIAIINQTLADFDLPQIQIPETYNYEWHLKTVHNNITPLTCETDYINIPIALHQADEIHFYDTNNEWINIPYERTTSGENRYAFYYNFLGQYIDIDELFRINNDPVDIPLHLFGDHALVPSLFHGMSGQWCWTYLPDHLYYPDNNDGVIWLKKTYSILDGSNDPYRLYQYSYLTGTLGAYLLELIFFNVSISPESQSINEWMLENHIDGLSVETTDQGTVTSNPLFGNFINYYIIPGAYQGDNTVLFYVSAPEEGTGNLTERQIYIFDWYNLLMGHDSPIGLKHAEGYEDFIGCDTIAVAEAAQYIYSCPSNICAGTRWRYNVYKINRTTKELEDITTLVLKDDIEKLDNTGFGCSGGNAECAPIYPTYLSPPTLHISIPPSPSPSTNP
jgi:hypothetical protein